MDQGPLSGAQPGSSTIPNDAASKAASGLAGRMKSLTARRQVRSDLGTQRLIQKSVRSKGVDLALCKRLAQDSCRRASAAESWATLVFGRLNREQSLSISRWNLPSWPRRTRPSCVSLPPRSCSS